MALGSAVTAVKLAGAGLSLTVVQASGRRLPQQLLSWVATAAAAVLTIYGGLLVVVGALAPLGVFGPPPADPTALRWHVLVWDLWFLLGGCSLETPPGSGDSCFRAHADRRVADCRSADRRRDCAGASDSICSRSPAAS